MRFRNRTFKHSISFVNDAIVDSVGSIISFPLVFTLLALIDIVILPYDLLDSIKVGGRE